MQIKINTIWTGSNYDDFFLDAVEERGSEVWVHYHKISNPAQTYSCLVDAFHQRFTIQENRS